ncbi:MAG: hypothetical protein KAR84_00395 [Elusimicrobiales bacterium]|nr:hypothetical protein [Elusimicrobiales bacterium]
MTNKKEQTPNASELQFLNLAYNRFYDLFDEAMDDSFWDKDAGERLFKIQQAYSIYSELLNYDPIIYVIQSMKKLRPPMEAEIASEIFKFVRHLISHFPFYTKWDDIWINKALVNWYKEGQSIDRFLKKYEGREQVKYRFFESNKKRMTYLFISFPEKYIDGIKIYLKDILTEKEGVKFSFILMKEVLDTQVEEIKNTDA